MRFLLALLTVGTLLAHHSVEKEFDKSKQVDHQVTVEEVRWENPHLIFTAKEGEGSQAVVWTFEMGSPNGLTRAGFKKDTLKKGDVLTVRAFSAKDGSRKAVVVELRWPDGKKFEDSHAWSNWMPAEDLIAPGNPQ